MIGADVWILAAMFLFVAVLYSSVGHAGASGYLAAMALLGVAPGIMRPTALALNILVASVATVKFYRAGSFSWRLFVPLAAVSIPLAYLGGRLALPTALYKPLVGVVLVYAAWRSFRTASRASETPIRRPSTFLLFGTGAGIGFLSGLLGVGGGIFLSPFLLLFRWARANVVSGVAAAFILVNSTAGLSGTLSAGTRLHPALPLWGAVVLIGGFCGAELGSRRLGNPAIQRTLALVVFTAGMKLIAFP